MATHQAASGPTQASERSIWIYGNPDKTELGFPMPGDLTHYIRADIFAKEKGRYRYTQGKNADVIVLSRDGLAYGHFEVEDKVKPTDTDRKAYPRVKFVYLIRTSTLYSQPVPLSSLSITKIHYGRKITEAEFQELQKLAGGTEVHLNTPSLPQSTVDLERVLREVKRRLGQSDFRKGLIAAYNSRCAVSVSSDNYSSPSTTTRIPDLPSIAPTSTTITFPDRRPTDLARKLRRAVRLSRRVKRRRALRGRNSPRDNPADGVPPGTWLRGSNHACGVFLSPQVVTGAMPEKIHPYPARS